MSLPALTNWDATRIALHQAAQPLGQIRKMIIPHQPNHAHLTLPITKHGLTTGETEHGTLSLDFIDRTVTYLCPAGDLETIPLAGHTQLTLTEAILAAMDKHGHPVASIDRTEITGTTPLEVDAALAKDYAGVLYSMFTTFARFRAGLIGYLSPVNVWPHGFDLSTLWFAKGAVEEQDPHLNFGFSPGSPGFARPYIYVYARPMPAGFLDIKLPEPAYWTRDKWTGIVIDYDFLAKQADHEDVLNDLLGKIYAAAAPLLQ